MNNGVIMEFIEYVKEITEKVVNENGVCRLKMGEEEFILHDECFCDLHEDFMIMYDKKANVSMVTRYDAIQTMQYASEEQVKEVSKDMAKKFIDKLIEGLQEEL